MDIPEGTQKQFDSWFILKPKLHSRFVPKNLFFREGQVWWCSLGSNVGIELDGKNEQFERPVLILKVFNANHLLVVPAIGHARKDRYHIPVILCGKPSSFVLSQVRSISSKRIIRKMSTIVDPHFFKDVIERFKILM